MKRTQLYLDEQMAGTLAALSREKGMSVSELVRQSLEQTYEKTRPLDKAAVARRLAGIWKKRKGFEDIETRIRKGRRGNRMRRLGGD